MQLIKKYVFYISCKFICYNTFDREIFRFSWLVSYITVSFTEPATFNIPAGRWLATFNCEIPLVYISATCAAVYAWLVLEWFSLWRVAARTSVIVVAHGKMHVIRVTLPVFHLHYHQCQLNRAPLVAQPFIAAINFNYLPGPAKHFHQAAIV